MRLARGITATLFLLLIHSAWAQTPAIGEARLVIYQDRPIPLSMVPGEEKRLSFPEDVQWFEPASLVGLIHGEATAGQVLLTASEPFEQTRFRFHGIDSGRFYLIDLMADERGERAAVTIRVPEAPPETDAVVDTSAQTAASGVVELTRYAMQQIYAPERLIEPLDDVSEVRLKEHTVKTRMVPGADVSVEPIAQWRTGEGLHAIVLLFTNRTSHPVELDPRQIRADSRWRTLALTNAVLAPANLNGDSTAGVVVADDQWSVVSEWLR